MSACLEKPLTGKAPLAPCRGQGQGRDQASLWLVVPGLTGPELKFHQAPSIPVAR